MIKRLLIIILFFGFSFGQELNSILIGTWKSISTEQSYIFLKNGNGYYNFYVENDDISYKFEWTIIESKSDIFDGTLILEYKFDNTYIYSIRILSNQFIKDNELEDFFNNQNFSYSGGEILMLTDSKNKNFEKGRYSVFEKY